MWLAINSNRQPLRLLLGLSGLGMVGNPFKRPRRDQAQNQEVVSAKAVGILPSILVSVRALKGDIE